MLAKDDKKKKMMMLNNKGCEIGSLKYAPPAPLLRHTITHPRLSIAEPMSVKLLTSTNAVRGSCPKSSNPWLLL